MTASNDMRPPVLTAEQKMSGCKKAVRARQARKAFKERIKSGQIGAAEALEEARASEVLEKMRVKEFIECFDRYGDKRSTKLMDELGISSTRRMRGLGSKQFDSLMETLA